MDNIDEIKNVLEFYTRADKLKTTLLDYGNYSVADNLFGSMILAVAFDSEFEETTNLTKIFKMLYIYEFKNLNLDYDFNKLKNGDYFVKLLSEARAVESFDSRCAFKYNLLDLNLTDYIEKNENTLDYVEFLNEGANKLYYFQKDSFDKCKIIFEFYYINYLLKKKERSGWDNKHWDVKTARNERVSEHIIGTIGLLLVLDSEFNYSEDTKKVICTLINHEIGETLIGDITPFDNVTVEQKKQIEHKAMEMALRRLSKKEDILDLLLNFDENSTPEGRLAFFLDKLDSDLKVKLYEDQGLMYTLDNQKKNFVYKSPKVQEIPNNGVTTVFDVWNYYDIDKYTADANHHEFLSILTFAKNNNLYTINAKPRTLSKNLKDKI